MPTGKVYDDGDESMKGQRIGRLFPTDDIEKDISDLTADEKKTSLPFNNGRFGSQNFYKVGDFVIYLPIR